MAQGSGNLVRSMNDLSDRADAGDVLAEATLFQIISTATAGVAGGFLGGLSKAAQNASTVGASVDYVLKVTRALNEVAPETRALAPDPKAKLPLAGSPPPLASAIDAAGDPYGFTAAWFTKSLVYKSIPTAFKTIMNSNAPALVKGIAFRIASNASMVHNAQAAGTVLGTSIFMRQGRYYAQFGDLMKVVTDAHAIRNKWGSTYVAGIPVSNLASKLDSGAIELKTFMDEAAKARILQTVPDNPQTAAVIAKLDELFRKTDEEMGEVGLSSFLKDYGEQLYLAERQASRSSGIFDEITTRQANRMRGHLEDVRRTIANLESDLNNRGLTGKQQKYLDDLIATRKITEDGLRAWDAAPDLDAKLATLDALDLTNKQRWFTEKLGGDIEQLTKKVDDLRGIVELGRAPGTEPYWPRVFNKREIEARQGEFTGILVEKIMNNPTKGYYVWDDVADAMVHKDWVGMSEDEVTRRVTSIVSDILDGKFDEVVGASPKSRHLMRRKLGGVKNSDIIDFINTDAREVTLGYLNTTGRKIEWAREFGYDHFNPQTGVTKRVIPSLLEVKAKADADMLEAGMSLNERNLILKDIDSLYQRVVGRVNDGPDTWDIQTAEVLRTATQGTFLGFASLAATADFANLLMDHELSALSKGLISMFSDYTPRMAGKELMLAGEGLEYLTGQFHTRWLESLTSNPMRNGFIDKVNTVYYKANLLEPITLMAKSMDAMFRGHTLIDPMIKILEGKPLTKWERTFLTRYGIDDAMARRIAVQPFERTQTGLIMPNTTAWTDQEAKEAFRIALRSGVMNRVIMGTPADKPLMMSGKVYIPMRIAGPLGMVEDQAMRGYAKVQNGFLSLPLTFYSFSLGALNNITANYAQGSVRNQTAHFVTAMAFGYMIYMAKTSPWQREKHSLGDKVMRSLDFSGLAAVYSDLIYRGIETASNLGAETPLSPRWRGGDPTDALVQFGGAPAEWSYDVLSAAKDLVSGEAARGAKGMVYSTPYLGVFWLRGLRRNLADGLSSMLEEK